jgi:hemoglobin
MKPMTNETNDQGRNEAVVPARIGTGAPPATPYERLGGEEAVRRLVARFYDLMELEPEFLALRGLHATSLDSAREKLFLFLSGWLGGPDLYVQRHGHPRLRARHLPFPIGVRERDAWLACMAQAMIDTGVEPALRERLAESFAKTADWMRNHPG